MRTESEQNSVLVPLDDLRKFGLVRSKGVRVDQASNGIALLISTVRVHLTTIVVGSYSNKNQDQGELSNECQHTKVNQSLVDVANNLDVVGSLHKLDTSEGTGRNHSSAMTGLATPGDGSGLGIGDDGVDVGTTPEAEVYIKGQSSRMTLVIQK